MHCVRRMREWTFNRGPRTRSTISRQELCQCLGWNFSQGACWPGGIPVEHRKQDPVNKDAVKSSSIIGPCHEDKWWRRRYIDSINGNGLCFWWPGCSSVAEDTDLFIMLLYHYCDRSNDGLAAVFLKKEVKCLRQRQVYSIKEAAEVVPA